MDKDKNLMECYELLVLKVSELRAELKNLRSILNGLGA